MNYIVTGPICSGKSTLLKIAEEFGFKTIRSDDLVSDLYNDKDVISKLMRAFDSISLNPLLKRLLNTFFLNHTQTEKK